jgi:predicted nuclease of predicted toxin-antitoxin system
MSVLRGFPPKVIWLRLGNCTTAAVETLLRNQQVAIQAFLADSTVGTLIVG